MIKLDFSKIAYNIENVPEDDDVIDRFPDLGLKGDVFMREDDLPSGVTADKVLRYLIYMFAPGTPVRDAFPDINQRKKYTLNKLNIDLDIDEGYTELCMMNAAWAVERFIVFTRLQCSEDYGIMETGLQRSAALQTALLTQSIDKSNDDKNFQEGLERWRDTVVRARERIMQDETSLVLQKGITFSASTASLGIQPEEYTRVWREKREIFPEIVP